MATVHLEVERKYTVPDGLAVPDLSAVGSLEPAVAARLEGVYFDTADRMLLRARIALRRRTGGADEGWHVKLPGAGGRTEVQEPIDAQRPDELPAPLGALLRARLRGRPVEPIAIVRTTRVAVVVRDGGGAAVEVVDDHVVASDVRAGTVRSWREWEAEAVGADHDASVRLLAVVDTALLAGGATRSASPAKLAQALGLGAPVPEPPATTAGAALDQAVAGLVEQLLTGEAALIDGGPAAVHELRRSIRRLRAVLGVRAVAGDAGAALRADLQQVGRLLGAARDHDVAAETAAGLIDALAPTTPGRGDARRELVEVPQSLGRELAAADLASFGSPRHFALLDALNAFHSSGPRADGRARPVLRAAMERAGRRAVRRAGRTGHDLDAMHDARRAARAFELLVRVLAAQGVRAGRRERRLATAAAAVHGALGTHRDLSLLASSLSATAERVSAAGGNAFALGILAERVRHASDDAEHAGRRALRRLVRTARRG